MSNGFNMLETVKAAIGVTGTYQDATIQVYIDETQAYMLAAGVPSDLIGTQQTAGTVVRGVSDLWNYGAGEGKLSPYFYERCIQLASVAVADTETDENGDSGEGV